MSRYLTVTTFNGRFVCVRRFKDEYSAIRHGYKECAKIEYMDTDMECSVYDAWDENKDGTRNMGLIWRESYGV